MNKTLRLILGVLLLAGIVAAFLWHRATTTQLAAENASLREQAAQLEALREENSRLASAQTNSADLQRSRAEQSELLRLRGEVTLLRAKVKELQDALARRAASAAAAQAPAAVEPASTPAAPVETYSAAVRASVPWKQTLVTGGWSVTPGKRTLVFVQPELAGEPGQAGQVLVASRILEIPEAALSQVGLQGLTSDAKQSSAGLVLTAEQTDAVMKILAQTPGVSLLAAPRVSTLDGRQAKISSTEVKTLPSGEKYEVGPTVDVTPQISADRNTVDLSISAQLRQPPPAKAP